MPAMALKRLEICLGSANWQLDNALLDMSLELGIPKRLREVLKLNRPIQKLS
jgi:hypothetical protein